MDVDRGRGRSTRGRSTRGRGRGAAHDGGRSRRGGRRGRGSVGPGRGQGQEAVTPWNPTANAATSWASVVAGPITSVPVFGKQLDTHDKPSRAGTKTAQNGGLWDNLASEATTPAVGDWMGANASGFGLGSVAGPEISRGVSRAGGRSRSQSHSPSASTASQMSQAASLWGSATPSGGVKTLDWTGAGATGFSGAVVETSTMPKNATGGVKTADWTVDGATGFLGAVVASKKTSDAAGRQPKTVFPAWATGIGDPTATTSTARGGRRQRESIDSGRQEPATSGGRAARGRGSIPGIRGRGRGRGLTDSAADVSVDWSHNRGGRSARGGKHAERGLGGRGGRGFGKDVVAAPNGNQTTLCVTRIPRDFLNDDALYEHFGEFGTVTSVEVDPRKFEALVSFDTNAAAKNAKSRGKLIGGESSPLSNYQ